MVGEPVPSLVLDPEENLWGSYSPYDLCVSQAVVSKQWSNSPDLRVCHWPQHSLSTAGLSGYFLWSIDPRWWFTRTTTTVLSTPTTLWYRQSNCQQSAADPLRLLLQTFETVYQLTSLWRTYCQLLSAVKVFLFRQSNPNIDYWNYPSVVLAVAALLRPL